MDLSMARKSSSSARGVHESLRQSRRAFVKSVKAAKKLLVVRDDLDLPVGTIKMTVHGRGSGGHKGVESVMRALKTKEFAQLKIGISGKTAKGRQRSHQEKRR
jgi:peptidyl-tRNA hydrolase